MTYLLAPLTTIVGAFGLIFGSFFNVVIWRVPRGESVVSPPSACPKCRSSIRARDNIPVLSWLALRGRCRDCSAPISATYPAVELLTGVVFAAVGLGFLPRVLAATTTPQLVALSLESLAFLVLASVSIVLSGTDLTVHRLPDAVVLPTFAAGAVLLTASALVGHTPERLVVAGIGALASPAVYFALAFLRPGGMGMGDVKLSAVLGLFLGYLGWGPLVVGFSAAFVIGGLAGVALIITRKKDRRGGIPFGLPMFLGAWLAVIAGEPIATAYLNFVGLG